MGGPKPKYKKGFGESISIMSMPEMFGRFRENARLRFAPDPALKFECLGPRDLIGSCGLGAAFH
jgi:hypothetical protein